MENKPKITNRQDLKNRIAELETKIEGEKAAIKINVKQAKEDLQPKKIIDTTFGYMSQTPEIQKVLVNMAVGFVLGFASKKAVSLVSEKSLDRSIHNMVSYQLTKLEEKDRDSFISRAITLVRKLTPPQSPIYPFIKY